MKMITAIFKIDDYFFRWRQAEMDELILDYLKELAYENKCEISELSEIFGFKNIRYMLSCFSKEVQQIWRENENKD